MSVRLALIGLKQPFAGVFQGVGHFVERFGLDLADPFAREAELFADLLQRARLVAIEPQ